jgi:hypothetical protein
MVRTIRGEELVGQIEPAGVDDLVDEPAEGGLVSVLDVHDLSSFEMSENDHSFM